MDPAVFEKAGETLNFLKLTPLPFGKGNGREKLHLTGEQLKESLNKSRLTAQHLSCLPFFRHLVQKALDNRQVACGLFAQPDEKIADAIQASVLP